MAELTLIAGCGIRDFPGEVVAVDYDMKSLLRQELARRVCADIRYLPFKPGVFSGVDFWNVLEHVDEKEPLVAELSRVSMAGAKLTFSAGLRRCDEMLGRISRTYRRIITDGYHIHSTTSAEYLDIISRHFRVRRIAYPGSIYVFLVEGLLDSYRVTISEAGEYLGPNGDKILGLAKRWTPLLQPVFGLFSNLFPEDLSQTVEVEAVRT